MNVLLAVLLCLTTVLAEESNQVGPHSTTVCIEIRPQPYGNPTKVCGPVVHGGVQQSAVRAQQKAAEPSMVFNLPAAAQHQHHSSESDESKEAEAPCATTGQKSAMPMGMRQAHPGPGPQHMMQRMEMPTEAMNMMNMMGMEAESGGWRQAGPPCAHNQRQPMGFAPMMPPLNRPPVHMANSRTWMVNPQQAMMMRAAEEMPMPMPMAMPMMGMGMRAAEEKGSGQPSKKESLENLLKECEEKTKLLQEKEAKITELKTHMANKKEEEMMKKE